VGKNRGIGVINKLWKTGGKRVMARGGECGSRQIYPGMQLVIDGSYGAEDPLPDLYVDYAILLLIKPVEL
jgi:hypothetical protein